jgi:hypothetical protein
MRPETTKKIKHALNTDVIRRLLIFYFTEKGYGNSFDRFIYPPHLIDLPTLISPLHNKIEITPSIEEIDPIDGKATIRWNMFILGSHRMDLGTTSHNDLALLAKQIKSGFTMGPEDIATSISRVTPKRTIAFICRVLSNSESGYTDLRPPTKSIQNIDDTMRGRGFVTGLPQQYSNPRISY